MKEWASRILCLPVSYLAWPNNPCAVYLPSPLIVFCQLNSTSRVGRTSETKAFTKKRWPTAEGLYAKPLTSETSVLDEGRIAPAPIRRTPALQASPSPPSSGSAGSDLPAPCHRAASALPGRPC
ncbi:MAG: hypothetical protein JWO19_2072 [Bryobacterales bacterium]|nr:hypothetical protein [Bryobacterales bacterium]